jgi:CD109 antigen
MLIVKLHRRYFYFRKSINFFNYFFRNYIIVGPKLVRPSDIVSVWVTILNKDWLTTNVVVSLFNQNDELASGEGNLIPKVPTAIVFQVPQNAPNGSYTIYIRGTLLDGDVVFYNETNVIFHAKSLSIFIQLDKPMYRHEQTGENKRFSNVKSIDLFHS